MLAGHGIREGDNLAPTLLILVLQLVAEDILRFFEENDVEMSKTLCNEESIGVLKRHHASDRGKMTDKVVNLLTRVDDSAMIFNNRRDTTKG